MFLLPVIPFITDTRDVMEQTIKDAKDVGVDFMIFGGMTLKEGKQKEYFFNILKQHYPKLATEYNMIYKGDKWGSAIYEYSNQLHAAFNVFMKYYKIPKRMPPELFKNIEGFEKPLIETSI